MASGFISAILVIGNSRVSIIDAVRAFRERVAEASSSYQIVLVANGCSGETSLEIKNATLTVPDLQVYCLASRVEYDAALVAGLRNTIGDWVFLSPLTAQAGEAFAESWAEAAKGYETVLLRSSARIEDQENIRRGLGYQILYRSFCRIYRTITGVNIANLSPACHLLSWPVATYVLQHNLPEIALRMLPNLSGFASLVRESDNAIPASTPHTLSRGISRAFSLLFEASSSPMRMVSAASLLASLVNVIYTVYVLLIALFKTHVAEGWITLSLQTSAMFLFSSLMTSLISEYLIQIHNNSSRRASYTIVRELRSNVFTREQALNVIVAGNGDSTTAPTADLRKSA